MILYGKIVAEKIYTQIQKEMNCLQGQNFRPSLAIILAGDDPASLAYVHLKEKIAAKLNIGFKLHHLADNIAPEKLEALILQLNRDQNVTGIVIQLPLPANIDTDKIIKMVDPQKDVDGFLGQYPAPTAQAILDILKFYQIDIINKKIVIVGHGRLVGAPLEKMLREKNIAPAICDSKIENLKDKTLPADVLISATGVPGLITPDMVKSDTIIIDAGAAESGGKMVGDVAQEVYQKISTYTPNPGGVGPVTVAELFKNLVSAAKS